MSEATIKVIVRRKEIRLITPDLQSSAGAYSELIRSCIISTKRYGKLSEWFFLQRMRWQFVRTKGTTIGITLPYSAYIHAMRRHHKRDMPRARTLSIQQRQNPTYWPDIYSVFLGQTIIKSRDMRWLSNAILEKRMTPEEYNQYLIWDR